MASWARQRQQITEAADGGARARTGADGAVVLNLRRGPGAYALLLRADGQLTRAGQHYYSHLGLRPPSKDFDYNQPLICKGPNDYILPRNGQKKLVRSLQGGEHRLTKLGKGFFRLRVPGPRAGDHPGQAAQRAERGAGYKRRDWLPVSELGGGEAGLCGQRANPAGAVRRLPQREDAEGERAAHQPGEPRGARRHGVRPEPQAASSGF